MKLKLQLIYYLASLMNLAEASVLSLYFVRNVEDSFPVACLILVASISFSLCVMGLGFAFQSIEKIAPPEAASYVEKKGLSKFNGFIFCTAFYFAQLVFLSGLVRGW